MHILPKDELLVSVIIYSSCEISWGSSYLISIAGELSGAGAKPVAEVSLG